MQRKVKNLRKNTKVFFTFLVAVSLSFSSFCAGAQEVFNLGEIVITATRLPQLLKDTPGSVTLITHKEIESSKAKNVAELLQKVVGVDVKSYGYNGTGTISIRGSSSNQVLVMIDGRPLNLASSGDVDLSLFSLDNVEKIEVVRGPFSALYGGGALGGVVNIITKNPPEVFKAKARLSYGSFNTSSCSFSLGETERKLGYIIFADKLYSEGERENSFKDSFRLNGKITFFPFSLSAGYLEDKKGVPGSSDWPTPNATQKDFKNWVDISFTTRKKVSPFSFKIFLNDDKIIYENPDWYQGYQKDTTKNKVFGVFLQKSFLYSKHNFIWGVDLKRENVDVRTIDGTSRIGGERKTESSAFYVEDRVNISPRLSLFLGARYDNNSSYGWQISPRVSLIYHMGSFTSLKASWGRAFRPPTINDLYWEEDWGYGMGFFGNPELVPEKSSEYEFGIERVISPRVLGRITFFSSHVEDLISWVETSTYRWEPQNIDEATIRGLETELKLRPFKKISCTLNYTLLEAKDEKEFKGNYLPYRPKNKFFLGFDYKISPEISFYTEAQVVGERYTDRENTTKLSPYTLVGTKLIFKKDRYEFFLKVDNLLDEEYENIKGYPMPGRMIKGGIEVAL